MRSVHFGAGNIGRGFIGQLLHESGYDTTFVDIRDDVVDALKTEGRYEVILADEGADGGGGPRHHGRRPVGPARYRPRDSEGTFEAGAARRRASQRDRLRERG